MVHSFATILQNLAAVLCCTIPIYLIYLVHQMREVIRMTREELINGIIDKLIELGFIELDDEPQSPEEG